VTLAAHALRFVGDGHLDQRPCCLNILEFRDPARARLMLFNDVSRYAPAPQPPRGHLSRWWNPTAADDCGS